MATQKQRRRRAKEKRHDYDLVYIDEDGVEQPVERDEPRKPPESAGGKATPRRRARRQVSRAGARRGREVQPPSWRKVLKRGAIFAPIFLATVMLLGGSKITIAAAIVQTVLLIARLHPVQLLHGPGRLAPAAEAPQPGARRRRSMSLAVDRLELGPIGTNTYLVRASASATEAVVVDPSGDAATIQAALAALGGALRRDPRHARPLRPHRQPRRPRRARPARRSTPRPAERILFEDRRAFTPPGITVQPARSRDVWLEGGETVDGRPASPSPSPSVPGHSPGHLAYFADGQLFSGDVLFAGSVGRTDLPGGDWGVLQASIATLLDAYPPETIVHPGHGPETTLGAELAAQPVPRRPARARGARVSGKIERPRGTHDVVPAEMPLWQRVTGEVERLCALYGYRKILTPVFEDTALFARTSGQGSDVVQKEMYTFTDRSDRSLTLRPGGHGADLPRLRRARHAPRSAAREDVHDRADVPLRRARARAATASTGRRRSRRSARDDPSIDAELIQLYDTLLHRLGVTAYHLELNSIGCRECRPAYLETLARLARGERAPPRRRHARQGRDEPAARLRQLPRQARRQSAPRSTRRRRSASRSARSASRTSPPCGPTSTRPASPTRSCRPSFAASTTTRGRPGSSSARWTTRTRPSPAAAATTGSSRRSAGRRRRASASAPGSSGCSSRWRTRASTRRAARRSTSSSRSRRARRGRRSTRWLAELRAEGVAADTDYAGRSLKGQLTQAGRLGAAATVVVGPDGAVLRRPGQADEPIAPADIVGRLSGMSWRDSCAASSARSTSARA